MVTAQLVTEGPPGLRAGLPEMGILDLRSEHLEGRSPEKKEQVQALKQEQDGKISKKAEVARVQGD